MTLQKLIEKMREECGDINPLAATVLVADILKLCEAAEKAQAYIDVCPCDPDITLEQTKAWREYQDALERCKG